MARRNARGQRGGKEGCITLQKSACGGKSCKEFCKRVYARVMPSVQHVAQGCDGFKRSAHSAVPNWMLGCLDALRIGGRIGRIGRMGRIEDQEDW